MNAHKQLLDDGFLMEVVENMADFEYYIIQLDTDGLPSRHRITKDLYDFYTEEKSIVNSLRNWDCNHRDNRELEMMLLAGDYIRAKERIDLS